MTTREAFKVGFLCKCAELGLTAEEIGAKVRSLLEKRALLESLLNAPVRLISSLGPFLGTTALVGGIGLPIAGGLAAGHLTAKAMEDDTGVNEAKTDELLAEYQRLTDHARRQQALKRLRGLPVLGGASAHA